MTNDLDQLNKSESLALLEVTALEKTMDEKITELDNINKNVSNMKIIQLKAEFMAERQILDTIFSTDNTIKVSTKIKYAYCKIIVGYLGTLSEMA